MERKMRIKIWKKLFDFWKDTEAKPNSIGNMIIDLTEKAVAEEIFKEIENNKRTLRGKNIGSRKTYYNIISMDWNDFVKLKKKYGVEVSK